MTAEEALDALLLTLDQLLQILPSSKSAWDQTDVVRLAVEPLWITAGNLAETYRIDRGIAPGIEPWSELAGYRNLLAHALPGDISSDRVYADSAADLNRILDELRATGR